MKTSRRYIVLRALVVTLLATVFSILVYRLGIAGVIVNLLPNASNLPKENANSVYDYYCLRTYQDDAEEDPDVLLVNISDYPRSVIGKTVSRVNQAGAKVIGIDACFLTEQPGDSADLIAPLLEVKNLVLGLGFSKKDDMVLSPSQKSYFSTECFIEEGVTNMYRKGRVITTFFPAFDADLPSFPWAIARRYNPSLDEDDVNGQYVNYMDFLYDWHMPYDALKLIGDDMDYFDDFRELAQGKIVIMGVVSENEDRHYIPSGEYVPGMFIHAYAVSSIIHRKYIRSVPAWLLWGVSALMCFLVTLLFYRLERYSLRYLFWIYKSIEVLVMIAILYLCLHLFILGWFVDFTPYFIIFAFQLFLSSIPFAIKETNE